MVARPCEGSWSGGGLRKTLLKASGSRSKGGESLDLGLEKERMDFRGDSRGGELGLFIG